MKKKIDLFWYWFILIVAFVLCFFSINNKKVNAYSLNSEGNVVGNNLFDVNQVPKGSNFEYNVVNNKIVIFNNTNNGLSRFYYDIEVDIGETYTFSVSSLEYSTIGLFLGENYNPDTASYCTLNSDRNNCTFVATSSILYIKGYISYSGSNSFTINEPMLNLGDSALPYEPYEVWYSQNNYDTAVNNSYDNGYSEGYDRGYADNNSIPTIYLDNAYVTYMLTTGGAYGMDITSQISNLNATLNFNSFLSSSWGNLVVVNGSFDVRINLLTSINVNDTLKFTFNDVSNSTKFANNFYFSIYNTNGCSSYPCPNSVYLSYEDIVSSNYEVLLSDFASENLLDVSFDIIDIGFYRENGFMYGISEVVDTSLLSDFDTQYDLGYKVGYINGNDAGLIEGEKIGFDKGYVSGYNKGISVTTITDDNSLVGLVGTVMTSPVNMLKTIFDFEFLGVNLSQFLFSLISLLIVIWLIKFFL